MSLHAELGRVDESEVVVLQSWQDKQYTGSGVLSNAPIPASVQVGLAQFPLYLGDLVFNKFLDHDLIVSLVAQKAPENLVSILLHRQAFSPEVISTILNLEFRSKPLVTLAVKNVLSQTYIDAFLAKPMTEYLATVLWPKVLPDKVLAQSLARSAGPTQYARFMACSLINEPVEEVLEAIAQAPDLISNNELPWLDAIVVYRRDVVEALISQLLNTEKHLRQTWVKALARAPHVLSSTQWLVVYNYALSIGLKEIHYSFFANPFVCLEAVQKMAYERYSIIGPRVQDPTPDTTSQLQPLWFDNAVQSTAERFIQQPKSDTCESHQMWIPGRPFLATMLAEYPYASPSQLGELGDEVLHYQYQVTGELEGLIEPGLAKLACVTPSLKTLPKEVSDPTPNAMDLRQAADYAAFADALGPKLETWETAMVFFMQSGTLSSLVKGGGEVVETALAVTSAR